MLFFVFRTENSALPSALFSKRAAALDIRTVLYLGDSLTRIEAEDMALFRHLFRWSPLLFGCTTSVTSFPFQPLFATLSAGDRN